MPYTVILPGIASVGLAGKMFAVLMKCIMMNALYSSSKALLFSALPLNKLKNTIN